MTDTKQSLYQELQKSPMFQLSLASKELFHSNFLAWIGSWDNGGEKGSEHPFRKLMKDLGAEHADKDEIWGDKWYVAREYRNFDLCVLNQMPQEFQDENDNGEKVLLVLENKIKSIPYLEQLREYQDKILDINFDWVKSDKNPDIKYKWQISIDGAKNHPEKLENLDPESYVSGKKEEGIKKLKEEHTDFLLLSMPKDYPEKTDIVNEGIWKSVDYSTYLEKLSSLRTGLGTESLETSIIDDYCKQLKIILQLHTEWTEKDFGKQQFLYFKKDADNKRTSYQFDYLTLKELRIHDLFQKQRYAKMCSELKKRIQEKVIKEFPDLSYVRHLDLRKDKELENKVYVDFNYLHGEPLLDIWLGADGYVYTIQVQGDSYEHGIQKMIEPGKEKGENSKSLWDSIWHPEKGMEQIIKGWNWICPFVGGDPFNFKGNGNIQLENDSGKKYFPIVSTQTRLFVDEQVYPNIPRKWNGKSYPYLKYELDTGVTFIYQYRKISDKAKVDEVLDYIVADLIALCEIVINKSQ